MNRNGVHPPVMEQIMIPVQARREKGPYAVIECSRKSPCSFCAVSCQLGAVTDREERPVLDPEKCDGCGSCVTSCPEKSCFVVDETFSELESMLIMPYDQGPLPKVGQMVDTFDQEGKPVGRGRVLKVEPPRSRHQKSVVSIALLKNQVGIVRRIGFKEPAVVLESAAGRPITV